MKDRIQVPAIFTGFSTRADGGATMRFATNELKADDFGMLAKMHNEFGYVMFKPNEYTDEDIPKGDATDERKSPSQRLRGVLFVWWEQLGKPGEFEGFYRMQIDKIIMSVKDKLD